MPALSGPAAFLTRLLKILRCAGGSALSLVLLSVGKLRAIWHRVAAGAYYLRVRLLGCAAALASLISPRRRSLFAPLRKVWTVRSEERRVGEKCANTSRYGWSAYTVKKNTTQ